jgi:hypothetical protein
MGKATPTEGRGLGGRRPFIVGTAGVLAPTDFHRRA